MATKALVNLVVLAFAIGTVSSATDKVVCYHGSWSVYRNGNGKFSVNDIDPNLCTHLIYSFVGATNDGEVSYLDEYLDLNRGNLASLVNLKKLNPNLKVLVAMGGWNEGSTKYSRIAADTQLRGKLVQSILDFVRLHDLDGFDIDWEYPAQRGGSAADKANYVALLRDLRAAFDPRGLILTAAVAASAASVDLSYDVPQLSNYLDFINVMAYDLHGSWDGVTGQNAPLYPSSKETTSAQRQLNVAASIRGWLERGAAPEKLVLGLGAYGRTYTLSTSNTGPGAPSSGAGNPGPYTLESGMMGYNEICELQQKGGWTVVWDDEQKTPYAYNGNQWVGYDNPESLAIKVDFARSLNLSGVMVWSIETDDFRGACGTRYPLLSAINDALDNVSRREPSSRTINIINEVELPVEEDMDIDSNDQAAVEVVVQQEQEAPANPSSTTNHDCVKAGYVRDKKDCRTFYYCLPLGSAFVPLRQECQVGLVFDDKNQVCNWPDLVSC